MPPPHLHPRSRMTSSLFATTVLASFFVVALPHILPCPAPRRAYADGEMPSSSSSSSSSSPGEADSNSSPVRRTRRRVVRRVAGCEGGEGPDGEVGIVEFRPGTGAQQDGKRARAAQKRECPVPKPGGILGEWLGFNAETPGGREDGGKSRPDR